MFLCIGQHLAARQAIEEIKLAIKKDLCEARRSGSATQRYAAVDASLAAAA
ncbi:MAG: hypothetical protein R3C99_27425 [Pirellulaceae bacterium]